MHNTSDIGRTIDLLESLQDRRDSEKDHQKKTEISDQIHAIRFLLVFESIRRRAAYGYKAPLPVDEMGLSNPQFRAAVTVARFLRESGFPVGEEVHWQGFVEFVFHYFGDRPPQIGQFRNPVLLERYVSYRSTSLQIPPERSKEELKDIYLSVLHPSLKTKDTLIALGLT